MEGFALRPNLLKVDLCGHATLAAAHVLYNHLDYKGKDVIFRSRSGDLTVWRSIGFYALDLPTDEISKVDLTDDLTDPFDIKPIEAYKGITDYMLIFENEDIIKI